MTSLLHEDVTEDIIGAAMAVLNELKPGLDEKIYERALIIELKSRGRHVESQKLYEVFYRDEKIGLLQPDLIVDNAVIVETKVADAFHVLTLPRFLAISP